VIAQLAGDPALRQRLGDAARQGAVERLSWEAHAASLEESLVEACALAAR
jgi:glycosyltransferase involved in cell wall biosynthesis